MAGLSTGTLHGKLGIRAGNTGLINLDDVRVPEEHRIGEEGEGFLVAMSAIDQGRFTVAAGRRRARPGLPRCLASRYAHERQTFGEEIGEHQLVKQMIAKMVAGTEIGRLLVWRAGWLKNQGLRNTRETSLAKWHATEHSVQSALDAIQIHGANGYSQRVPGRALPAQLQGGGHLRGDEPAPHAHPGRLRPGLPRGPAAALRAVAGPGLGAGRRADRERRPGPTGSSRRSAALAETFVRGDALRRARLAADALERAADPAQVRQLRLVLRLIESPVANLALAGARTGFSAMSPATRERYLLGWATSRLGPRRSAFGSLRKLLTFLAYADPGVGTRESAARGHRLRAGCPAGHRRSHADRAVRPAIRGRRRPMSRWPSRRTWSWSGSGAGGGVVAAELAAAGRSVVVLEAGPFVDEASMPRDELDAFGRLYLNHGLLVDLGRRGHDARRVGGRRRHARQLDDHASRHPRPSAPSGGASTASTAWPMARRGPTTSRPSSASSASTEVADPAPKDAGDPARRRALGWEAAPIRPQRGRLRRLRQLPVRLPARHQAVRDPGPPRRGVRGGRPDRAAGQGHARAPGGRPGGRRRGQRPGPGSGHGEPIPDPAAAGGVRVRRLIVRAPQVVVAAGALRTPAILEASGLAHPAIGRNLRIHPVPVVAGAHGRPDRHVARHDAGRSFARVRRRRTRVATATSSSRRRAIPGLLALALPWEGTDAHAEVMGDARSIRRR